MRMRRFLQLALYPLLAATVLLAAHFAQAAPVPGAAPLVIIRFNQPRVYYDQQLYNAVSKAVAAKPEVMFDIVSYAPETGNAQADASWQATASHNTRAVVANLQQMGVPMSRISVSGQRMAGIRYDETHVFVR